MQGLWLFLGLSLLFSSGKPTSKNVRSLKAASFPEDFVLGICLSYVCSGSGACEEWRREVLGLLSQGRITGWALSQRSPRSQVGACTCCVKTGALWIQGASLALLEISCLPVAVTLVVWGVGGPKLSKSSKWDEILKVRWNFGWDIPAVLRTPETHVTEPFLQHTVLPHKAGECCVACLPSYLRLIWFKEFPFQDEQLVKFSN